MMKRRSTHVWVAILAMAVLVTLVAPTVTTLAKQGHKSNPGVLPPQCKDIYGELAAEWWVWAFNCPPPPLNPIFDEDGSAAHVNQSGPIWFLAGTFAGEVERTCTVPAGKSLYIPLLNHMSFGTEPGDTPGKVRKTVTDGMKSDTELWCFINGEPLYNLFDYGAVSNAFDFPCTEGSLLNVAFGYPVGTYSPAVAGAYAVLLEPLPPGDYVIEFGGADESGWSVSVTYYLTVEGEDDD